jgi:hypothetical protein
VVGIEGIYPDAGKNYDTGSRLITGFIGANTLRALDTLAEPICQDLIDSIADRVGMRTTISAQVDAERRLVRLACGDARIYYRAEIAFARATFRAPLPADADIVVANAYPSDLTLASVSSQALAPMHHAHAQASRIVLASCPEGTGLVHPKAPWWSGESMWNLFSSRPRHRHPIWLFRPGWFAEDIPERRNEIRTVSSWESAVRRVRQEQSHKRFCAVYLYPCSPLQLLAS